MGSLIAGSEGHALELLVRDLADRGKKKLILDLGAVEKIDGTGAQFVLQCFFTMRRARGALRLAGGTRKVTRIFAVTRLDTLLPLYRTVTAASVDFELEKSE